MRPIRTAIDRVRRLPLTWKIAGVAIVALAAFGAAGVLAKLLHAFAAVGGVATVAGAGRSAIAGRLRRAAEKAADASDTADAHRAERERDAEASKKAAEAAAEAAEAAADDWTTRPHRKPPQIGGLALILALAAPARGQVAEPVAAGDNCVKASVFSEPPAGFGYWREGSADYYCPCFGRVDDFYDATRLPGGCLVPPMLPLIAYTVADNAQMWADMESAGVRLRALNTEVTTARADRDKLAAELAQCGRSAAAGAADVATAVQVPEPPNRLEWYAYGVVSAIVVYLAVHYTP